MASAPTNISPVCTFTGHSSSVWKSSFASDTSYLCTCSSDETTRIWERSTSSGCPAVQARLSDHVGVVRGCDFSPDSTLLSTCSWDKRILLYRTSELKAVSELLGHRYGVCYVKFSPCGHFLLSCSWDDNIGVWDVSTGTLLHWLEGHCSPVSTCTVITPPSSGKLLLASSSWDGTVKVWDTSESQAPVVSLSGHPDAVFDVSACPTNTDVLASCGRKGSFIIWDLRTTAPLQMLSDRWIEFNCVSFSPSGQSIVVGDSMGQTLSWQVSDLTTNLLTAENSVSVQAHASSVTDVNFSKDGSLLASCSTDHTCKIWHQADSGSAAASAAVNFLADSLVSQLSLSK